MSIRETIKSLVPKSLRPFFLNLYCLMLFRRIDGDEFAALCFSHEAEIEFAKHLRRRRNFELRDTRAKNVEATLEHYLGFFHRGADVQLPTLRRRDNAGGAYSNPELIRRY